MAPEPTSAPAPTRTAGPPTRRTAAPSSRPPPQPDARKRDVLTSALIAGAVFLLVGVPLSSMVYRGVASVFDDGSDGTVPGGNWQQAARMGVPEGPADPSPGDPSEAQVAAMRPPAIPDDYQPSAPLTPGVLPGGPPPMPVPAPRRESADTDPAEAVIQSVGALQSDRVVVRLHSSPAGARVGVDGRSRGRTPAKLMLNPGRYALQITLGDATTEVQLEATENQRLCFAVQDEGLGTVDCANVL